MSERLKHIGHEGNIGEATGEFRQEKAAEHAKHVIESAAKSTDTLREGVEKLEKAVEAARPSNAEKVKKNLDVTQQDRATPLPDRAAKQQALRTSLGQVRHHLSGPGKSFSKFVHNPMVNKVSDTAGKTIIRPSGTLSGGLCTLLGSGYYYYATKQTGYHYSFTIALLLFVGGFAIGLVAETVHKLLAGGVRKG